MNNFILLIYYFSQKLFENTYIHIYILYMFSPIVKNKTELKSTSIINQMLF